MTRRLLLGASAAGLMLALAAPPSAEAAHRHSRSCGHRWSSGYGYKYGYSRYRPYYVAPPPVYYGAYAPPGYYYGYDPYYSPRYYSPYRYYAPYKPYYRRHGRWPRVNIHIGF